MTDLKGATNAFAIELVGEPTPGAHSNLTSGSLPNVCADLALKLTDNFPQSCAPFFQGQGKVYGGAPSLGGGTSLRTIFGFAGSDNLAALTGPTSLVNASKCTTNGTFELMWSQFGDGNSLTYTYANWWVMGLITAFMPIADVNRPVTLAFAESSLTCIRSTNVNKGSTPVGAAPAPTSISTVISSNNGTTSGNATSSTTSAASDAGHSLSGGAIAGIVIGVIAGLALVALAIFSFLHKRLLPKNSQTSRNASAELDGSNSLLGSEYKGTFYEAPGTNTFYEMSTPTHSVELYNTQPPIELPLDTHSKFLRR